MNDNSLLIRCCSSLTIAIALSAVVCLVGCGKRDDDAHSGTAPVSDSEQSKPTNGGTAAEQVVVTDEDKQWPVKLDWDSLRYVPNLLGDKSPYRFWTSDHYPIYLWLSLPHRVDDDGPPKEELTLDLSLPNIDLKQSPDLQHDLVKAVDRLTQEAQTDKVRRRLKYLRKEVLRRSKIPNHERERPNKRVTVKENPKQLLVKQLLRKVDWDSLKYKDQDLAELMDGGFIYEFETPDHYLVSVYLSGQTDDMEPEELLRLGIDPPKIDLTKSPNLLQRVVNAVDHATHEADVEWRKNELTQLKQEILRRSKTN